MEHPWMVSIGIFLGLIIIVLGYLIAGSFNPVVQVNSGNNSNNFKTLQYHGEGRINLLFFGSEALSRSYAETLLSTEPFTHYKDAFNVFVIDDFSAKCEYYKDIAILCDSRELQKQATRAPHDYIIVLKSEPSAIRSSSLKNVMSINTNHPKSVIVHEFGHAFANFAEEYAPAKIPRGAKNCQSECNGFGDKVNECKVECSDSDHVRSISLGVMRSLLTTEFGLYDKSIVESLIKERSPKAKSDIPLTGHAVQSESEQLCKETVAIVDVTNKESNAVNEVLTGCVSPKESNRIQVDEEGNPLISTDGITITGQSIGGFEEYNGPIYIDASIKNNGVALVQDYSENTIATIDGVGRTACEI